MKIVSLLPSATEIVYALGLGDQLVGVSCDCDHPSAARAKAVVSRSTLDVDQASSPADVDQQVRDSVNDGNPIYRLDRDLVRELQPDLILAQDLCRVCAVPSGHVTDALESLGCSAEVISLDPNTLDDVLNGIEDVARATGAMDTGRDVIEGLRDRVAGVRQRTEVLRRVRVFALEWSDPPFTGGHWIPEMVRLAGGHEVLGIEGAPSRACRWEEVAAAAPEVIVFMPCGYGLSGAVAQADGLSEIPEFSSTPAAKRDQVWAVDGSSYFSRPGPRLVDGLETLAWILHPESFPEPPAGRVRRVNGVRST